jgi:hypothetical protein
VTHEPTALVRVHDASCCLTPSVADRVPSAVLGGLSLAGMLGIACLIASPLSSLWAIGALTGSIIAAATIPWRRRGTWTVDPDEIADPELRADYRALLMAHHELAAILVAHDDATLAASALLDRSRDTVVLCGQVARTTNHVCAYLARHDPASVGVQATRLQHCADEPDPEAARLFASAAEARQRQLAAVLELRAMRARVQARLELATSSLHAAIAGLVKMHAIDDESLALAGETIAEHADDLETELAALASVEAVCTQ